MESKLSNNQNLMNSSIVIEPTTCYGFIKDGMTFYDDYNLLGDNIIISKLSKIKTYSKNNKIIGIVISYKNRINQENFNTVNITCEDNDVITQEMTLKPFEFINKITIYKDDQIRGFILSTNRKNSQLFGYQIEQSIEIDEIDANSLLIGFYLNFSTDLGLSSIGFYYVNSNIYKFNLMKGLLFLRLIIQNKKDNENYKNLKDELKNQYNSFDFEKKILFKTCCLPDNQFNNILKYCFY